MREIQVAISRLIEDAFPSWVECEFYDVHGRKHTFREKLPVVSDAECANSKTELPTVGQIRCAVVSCVDEIYTISTVSPDGIESVDGISEFQVKGDQLI